MSVTRNLTLLSLVATLNCGAAYAQQDQLGGAPAERLTMSDPTASDLSQQLTLTVNKSYMLESNTDIGDIIVANPAIANVVARSGRRVAVMGMAPGESNIVFLDRTGRQIKVLEVSVTDGISGMDQLRGLIKRHVPEAKVAVESANGQLLVSGRVPNVAANDAVMKLARPYARDDDSIVNLMTISGKDQVTLRVRFVEMQRSVIKQLGVNLSGSIGFGQLTGTAFDNNVTISSSNAFPIAGSSLGGLAANLGYKNFVGAAQQSSAGALVNALERVGVVRTLAEPNLAAVSGEAGKFLVGGEFPVPVAQDEGKIGIEFKPFGVGLAVPMSEDRVLPVDGIPPLLQVKDVIVAEPLLKLATSKRSPSTWVAGLPVSTDPSGFRS
jgi:pilus assembly protein CpaC